MQLWICSFKNSAIVLMRLILNYLFVLLLCLLSFSQFDFKIDEVMDIFPHPTLVMENAYLLNKN